MADRDFDLRILKAGSHYLADVRSPDGEEANCPFELPISPEHLDELFRGLGHPRKATRGGGSPEVRQARDFGRQLFEAVFASEIRDVFQRSLGRVEARGGDLRIRLRFARDVPELLDLPWELLFDRGRNRFLALEPATLVRHLPVQQRIEPMRVAPPLHILVAISNPAQAGYPALDVEQEWANLDQALGPLVNRGRVSLTRLDGVTQESLRQVLKRGACHVLHYIGHGRYDSASEIGLLALEDKDGGARPCGASRLTYLLREQPALRLVVLNACEGGRSSRTDPFAGVAQSLVQGALPAVVAMQFPVTDAAAVVFASAFYEALAAGKPVDLALADARREVNVRGEEGEIEWATPVLYMRGDGELFTYEERERAQVDATSVVPIAPIPSPGPGAVTTLQQGREQQAELSKTQVPTEQVAIGLRIKKPMSKVRRSLRAIASSDAELGPCINDIWRLASMLQWDQRGSTTQGREHCEQVEENALRLLVHAKSRSVCTPTVAFILSAAAALHDVGKIVRGTSASRPLGDHGAESRRRILEGAIEIPFPDPEFRNIIADVVGVHAKDRFSSIPAESRQCNGQEVWPRSLAAVFRLADMLDTTAARAPSAYCQFRGALIERHPAVWLARGSITGWRCDEDGRQVLLQARPSTPEAARAVETLVKLTNGDLHEGHKKALRSLHFSRNASHRPPIEFHLPTEGLPRPV